MNNRIIILAAALAAVSCSSTRLLKEGEYRLAKNSIEYVGVEPDTDVLGSMTSYIRQQSNSAIIGTWSPLVNIYSMSGPRKSVLNRIIRNFGEAPVIYDSTATAASVRNLQKHMEYVGYFGSKVEAQTTYDKKIATVLYRITPGKRYPVSSIVIELPDNDDFREVFYADTANMLIHPGDYLSEAVVEAESSRSAKYLRDKGYYAFSKSYYSFEADTVKVPGEASLKMIVMDHTRNETARTGGPLVPLQIGDVEISYPASLAFNDRILRGVNGIVPGDIYSERVVDYTYSRLSQMKVFSGVQVTMDQVSPTLLDCHIELTPARLRGFKVNLEGSTNSSGLIGISPQLSYYNRNLFHGGEWLNLGFLGNFQFRPGDDVSAKEFGTNLSISFPRFLGMPLRRFRGANLPRTELTLSYNFQDRPEYKRNAITTSFGYTGKYKSRLSYQLYPLQLNIIRVHNLDEEFRKTLEGNPYMQNAYLDHFDLGTGGVLYYTTNSDVNPKTSYRYWRLQFDTAGNVLSLFNPSLKKSESGSYTIWDTPYSQYVRLEGSLGRTWVFGKNDNKAFAVRFLAGMGFAYGNSKTLPFEKQFYGGGASSLRGWQARSVGPGTSKMYDVFTIPSQTGDCKFEVNAEYRFPLFWLLRGAVFVDAGNVWDWDYDSLSSVFSDSATDGQFSFKTLPDSFAMNWGLGLRIDISVVLLRLDMGLRLHDPSLEGNKWLSPSDWFSGSKGYAIHFGVGYPF